MKFDNRKLLIITMLALIILTSYALIESIFTGWTDNIMYRTLYGIVALSICLMSYIAEDVKALKTKVKELESKVK